MKKLNEFTNSVESNTFTHDLGFQQILEYFFKPAETDRLFSEMRKWEERIATWDALAKEASRVEKFPRIEKYDFVGKRIEKIILPLETQTIRREVVKTGIFSNASETEKFAKIYLLSQIGEAGVTCPLACTDGLIRVVTATASDAIKKKYLPLLASMEYPLAGAQFITEQAGGSDVGAIEGAAKKCADGTYLLTAEKWYCSAADEFFLIAARPEGAPLGTDGVAVFFVPRTNEQNGQVVPNNLFIKRLKDKLGTQSLPTAEIDFQGSQAYLLGTESDGFHHLMNYVLNCSRIHNAANSLGFMRRAFAESRNYAEQRGAFGKEIIHFPLVQQYLVSQLSHLTAKRNMFFATLKEIDKNGFLPTDVNQSMWQRNLINMNKFRTASQQTERVKEAILVFGANGIVQDFSIVPRLLRDSLIIETWEGTHNILSLQIMKDSTKSDFWQRCHGLYSKILQDWPEQIMPATRARYTSLVVKVESLVTADKLKDRNWVQAQARNCIDYVAGLLEIGNLVRQGVKQDNRNVLLMAHYLLQDQYGNLSERLEKGDGIFAPEVALSLIREEPVTIDLKTL